MAWIGGEIAQGAGGGVDVATTGQQASQGLSETATVHLSGGEVAAVSHAPLAADVALEEVIVMGQLSGAGIELVAPSISLASPVYLQSVGDEKWYDQLFYRKATVNIHPVTRDVTIIGSYSSPVTLADIYDTFIGSAISGGSPPPLIVKGKPQLRVSLKNLIKVLPVPGMLFQSTQVEILKFGAKWKVP